MQSWNACLALIGMGMVKEAFQKLCFETFIDSDGKQKGNNYHSRKGSEDHEVSEEGYRIQ